jgi:hypothetical protein
MHWYEIFKVIHFVGLIALFGFFVLYARAGERLQTARTLSEARTLLAMLESTRGMLRVGAVMLIVSGAAMTMLRWHGAHPFLIVGFIVLLISWIVCTVVGPRHERAIRAAIGDTEGSVTPDIALTILDPTAWGTVGAANGASIGVLVVMTLKVDWVTAFTIVLVLAAFVSAILTTLVRGRRDSLTKSQGNMGHESA